MQFIVYLLKCFDTLQTSFVRGVYRKDLEQQNLELETRKASNKKS